MAYSSTLEIIQLADTIDLTVLATAKEELGITDNSQDTKLTRWIHEISGQIGARINRVLGRETVKETYSIGFCDASYALPLSRYPVAFIDSISISSSAISATDYRLDGNKGLLYRTIGSWSGMVEVQYQAGYELLGELPYDLERACLLLLRYRQSAGSRDPMLRSEAVPGVYEASYWIGSIPGTDSSMPPDVSELLRPYMDIAV